MEEKLSIRGGLWLGSAVAIFAAASSDVVAAEEMAIEDARNTLTQIYWRINAHNIIEDTKWKMKQGQIKDEPWFVDPEYEESIKKVIGEAIADCVTNRNEFKDKKAGDLITFEGQDENYIGYTREN